MFHKKLDQSLKASSGNPRRQRNFNDGKSKGSKNCQFLLENFFKKKIGYSELTEPARLVCRS